MINDMEAEIVSKYREGKTISEIAVFYMVRYEVIVEILKKGYDGEIEIK